jgi:hypothetical protein
MRLCRNAADNCLTTKLFLKYFSSFTADRSKFVGVEAEAPPLGLKFTKAISFVLMNWVMTSFMTT